MLDAILAILDDSKAHDVRVYDVRKNSMLADFFIVASGDAAKHIDAIAEKIKLKSKTNSRHSIEGTGTTGWVLCDTGEIIVHLFSDERRSYYRLDELYQ